MAPPPLRAPHVSFALGMMGGLTLLPLLVSDVAPTLFPQPAHDVLAAIPLATIGFAYLIHQRLRGARGSELARAIVLALAFLFWAANQVLPDRTLASLCNDIAIAAFVFDLVQVILRRAPARPAPMGDGMRFRAGA
jgi:hypothetical protein